MSAKSSKKLLSSLILPNQTTYLENRFVSVGGLLIPNILEVTNILKIKVFFLKINVEKVFDSGNHILVFHVLEKFGFGKNFLKWIKILLKNHEPCVIDRENQPS